MPVVMQDVSSQAIRAIGYDTDSEDLYIEFNKPYGGYPTYIWPGVPEGLFAAFLGAPSKGEFYHRYIKRGSFGTGLGVAGKITEALASRTAYGKLAVVAYKVGKKVKGSITKETVEKAVVFGSMATGSPGSRGED
jgi:hypothetical protein